MNGINVAPQTAMLVAHDAKSDGSSLLFIVSKMCLFILKYDLPMASLHYISECLFTYLKLSIFGMIITLKKM